MHLSRCRYATTRFDNQSCKQRTRLCFILSFVLIWFRNGRKSVLFLRFDYSCRVATVSHPDSTRRASERGYENVTKRNYANNISMYSANYTTVINSPTGAVLYYGNWPSSSWKGAFQIVQASEEDATFSSLTDRRWCWAHVFRHRQKQFIKNPHRGVLSSNEVLNLGKYATRLSLFSCDMAWHH